ncbi:hypothetical protein [Lederbergia citri]|uniref:Uncharacterized protein n=1 Tax=Lederbergia citri TaxID=2833580 RepID=A0A942YGH2_9BACI|nr:hypothetical protein [Lederbergia citri]MBS4194360.1 hypothetical protein [Lederbergia citri]
MNLINLLSTKEEFLYVAEIFGDVDFYTYAEEVQREINEVLERMANPLSSKIEINGIVFELDRA